MIADSHCKEGQSHRSNAVCSPRSFFALVLLFGIILPAQVEAQNCFQSNQELIDAVQGYVNDDPQVLQDYGANINDWCVSGLTDLSGVFSGLTNFSEPIDQWDVSNALEMNDMFRDATSFNENIASWNVSNVRTMRNMFFNADSFNQPIGSWVRG